MRIVIVTQLVAALIATMLTGWLMGWMATGSALYGAILGMVMTMLTKRSVDRTLKAAVENPRYSAIALFSGFALRYAVAILGLITGFTVLRLSATPMVSTFILMILVQAFSSPWMKDRNEHIQE